ncbi:MAG: GAF domain-containing protein [Anaerolineae bacterium]|nr:MAG: GAF domain-containing protein [Anaerolineae bacterium]
MSENPPKIRVLLIEDNPGDARLIAELMREFEHDRFEISHALDLETGLTKLEEGSIQALLLDLSLPDSQGLSTFIQAHEASPLIPVIILTGTSDRELALNAVRKGAQDYLVKGEIDARLLSRALQYALERSRREREMEAIVQINASMRMATNRDEMVRTIVERVATLLQASAVALSLVEPGTEVYTTIEAIGDWEDTLNVQLDVQSEVDRMVLSGQVVYVNNDTQANPDPRFVQSEILQRVRAVALAPLVTREASIGILAIGRDRPYDDTDLALLRAIADMAANAIQRASLYEQTERRLQRLNSLRTIDLAISTSFNLDLTLRVFLEQLTEQLEADAAAVLLLDPAHVLRCAAARGFHTRLIHEHSLHLGEGYSGRAASDRRTVALPHVREAEPPFSRAELISQEDVEGFAAAPLVVKGEVIGVLEVFTRFPLNANHEWTDFFETLAGQAAIAIYQAQLFDKEQRGKIELELAYGATLEGWVRVLDLRDQETEGHTQRVTELVLRLAERMEIPSAQMKDFRRGALLHDIGKMAVPDSILRKPGKLTPEEWEVMKAHTVIARDLLEPITYLGDARQIPYCHHEKWDGSGYPQNLKGSTIPLYARIFAVVDVYDALTSDRPYRKAWPQAKAIEYIKEESGKHFDPTVVDIFLNMMMLTGGTTASGETTLPVSPEP